MVGRVFGKVVELLLTAIVAAAIIGIVVACSVKALDEATVGHRSERPSMEWLSARRGDDAPWNMRDVKRWAEDYGKQSNT